MHTFLRSLMLAGLALTTAAAVPLSRAYAADQAAVPASSGGVYTDSAGGKHVWNINSASALIWDGKPYMPVGANFYPISLKSDQPTDYDRDLAALADLKSRGVKDIIIVPEGTLANLWHLIRYRYTQSANWHSSKASILQRLRGCISYCVLACAGQ